MTVHLYKHGAWAADSERDAKLESIAAAAVCISARTFKQHVIDRGPPLTAWEADYIHRWCSDSAIDTATAFYEPGYVLSFIAKAHVNRLMGACAKFLLANVDTPCPLKRAEVCSHCTSESGCLRRV